MRRYDLWEQMRRMQEQMDNLFGNFLSDEPQLLEDRSGGVMRQPVSDIYETENEVVAELDMPGLDKKDIKLNVNKDSIEVKAEKKKEDKQEDKKGYRLERSYSGFYRSFRLPESVDANKAEAEYKDGVLKITVPKVQLEEQKRKQIDIK